MDSEDSAVVNGMVHAYATDREIVTQAMNESETRGTSLADKMMTECQRETQGALRIRLSDEWRAALVRGDASEIPVTPEMMDVARRCFRAPGLGVNDIPAIYRAMAALAPRTSYDPEYRAMSDQLGDTIRERDAALKHCNELERARDGWQAEAAQFHRNQRYYAGLLDQAGELLGPAAMTTDDGTFTGEVLRAKVGEVLYDTLATKDSFIDKLTDSNCSLGATNERLRDEISALTAEKNALHDALAKFTAIDSKPVPLGNKPHASDCAVHNEPASPAGPCNCGAMHNPFREFPGDRRRMGLA